MFDRRVVVTGMGVVSSLGTDMETFWERIIKGDCGIDLIKRVDFTGYDCRVASEVLDFDPLPAFPSAKEIRHTDRYCQFAVYAGWKALQDSGLDLSKEDRDQIGCIFGSGIGGLETTQKQHTVLLEKGPSRISPFMIPMLIVNISAGMFSIYHGLKGPNLATCSACATSTHAIGEAWRAIKMNDADVMFAGGAEAAITGLGIGGFCSMKALSTRNDDPKHASRPFDAGRDGFVMGEGAGVVVLEELEHAKKRGARIYAELSGYGNTADAYHMTAPAPNGEGAGRCMAKALRNAGMKIEDVDYINAHGTSTHHGDIAEIQAIKSVFGEHAYKLAVSSTKGAHGHMLGATGAVEFALTCKAVQTGIIPPTINHEVPDPACDLDVVPNVARKKDIRVAMSNSFGFGGHNATLVCKKYTAE